MNLHRLELPGHGVVDIWVGEHRESLAVTLFKINPPVREAAVTWLGRVYLPNGEAKLLPRLIAERSPELLRLLAHEYVHVLQWRHFKARRFIAKYITAEGRLELEREAYLHEVRHCGTPVGAALDALCSPLYRADGRRAELRAWLEARLKAA